MAIDAITHVYDMSIIKPKGKRSFEVASLRDTVAFRVPGFTRAAAARTGARKTVTVKGEGIQKVHQ